MKTTTFKKKLIKVLEDTGEFATDLIDMRELRRDTQNEGFDDIVLVTTEDTENDGVVFTLIIKRIDTTDEEI